MTIHSKKTSSWIIMTNLVKIIPIISEDIIRIVTDCIRNKFEEKYF